MYMYNRHNGMSRQEKFEWGPGSNKPGLEERRRAGGVQEEGSQAVHVAGERFCLLVRRARSGSRRQCAANIVC